MIDEIEKQLKLSNSMVEPSRAVLYRYGNTSSSSIWCVGVKTMRDDMCCASHDTTVLLRVHVMIVLRMGDSSR